MDEARRVRVAAVIQAVTGVVLLAAGVAFLVLVPFGIDLSVHPGTQDLVRVRGGLWFSVLSAVSCGLAICGVGIYNGFAGLHRVRRGRGSESA